MGKAHSIRTLHHRGRSRRGIGSAPGVQRGELGHCVTLDRFGRVIDHNWQISATAKDRYRYGYDAAGNVISGPKAVAEETLLHFVYDAWNRLAEAWDDSGDGGTWELVQGRSHNKVNEIDTNDLHNDTPGESITASTGANWVDPAHDAAGNVTLCPRPGKESETAYADEALLLVYDCWNRLAAVWEDQDADGEFETQEDKLLAKYGYDGLHRRQAGGHELRDAWCRPSGCLLYC